LRSTTPVSTYGVIAALQNIANLFLFLMVVTSGSLVAVVSANPVPGEPVLILSAQGVLSREHIVRSSGGRLIGPTSAPLASLAVSDDPEFVERLRSLGTFMVLDGRSIAQLCGASI
tara:strand:+ start:14 stop:361 length:348 start_codon:yes stop_codon:yes gene_type:complete